MSTISYTEQTPLPAQTTYKSVNVASGTIGANFIVQAESGVSVYFEYDEGSGEYVQYINDVEVARWSSIPAPA